MDQDLKSLYKERKGKYVKDPGKENFLLHLNETLQKEEQRNYSNYTIENPFIFVFGLPRSGTTLITQLLAHSFDFGFINNFMARFWLAPIHGIRLNNVIYGNKKSTSFTSDYAATKEITDIHEFGYFWRYWLKKESFMGVTNAKDIEKEIDWQNLKLTLANIQAEFEKPMVFKNIFGSYHLEKLRKVLDKVIYVYIKRDILDSAVSILGARKKYYSDPNTWWSYMPIEYDRIKNLDYWNQIAGQVYFLKKYYDEKTSTTVKDNTVTVDYKQMAENPRSVLDAVNAKSKELFSREFEIVNEPPKSFPFRTYTENDNEKNKFQELINKFKAETK